MTAAEKRSAGELESLIVEDGEQAVDSLLRTTLESYVGFTREGRLITKPPFLKISNAARILVALLAHRAMARLGLPGASQEVTAEQLGSECLVAIKGVREIVSRFKSRRLVEKSERGYHVPVWAVSEVAAAIEKKA